MQAQRKRLAVMRSRATSELSQSHPLGRVEGYIAMSNRTINLDDRLYQYLLDYSLRESDLMRELREVTAQQEMSRMQIAPEQGQFMALLVELIEAERIIEVGTFTGYSALCMAQAMPENGALISCGLVGLSCSITRSGVVLSPIPRTTMTIPRRSGN